MHFITGWMSYTTNTENSYFRRNGNHLECVSFGNDYPDAPAGFSVSPTPVTKWEEIRPSTLWQLFRQGPETTTTYCTTYVLQIKKDGQ